MGFIRRDIHGNDAKLKQKGSKRQAGPIRGWIGQQWGKHVILLSGTFSLRVMKRLCS